MLRVGRKPAAERSVHEIRAIDARHALARRRYELVDAAIARERDAKPQTLHYGIVELDQESVRMRAAVTANAASRRDRQAARAHRRRATSPPAADTISFRRPRPWPAWVALGLEGDPIIIDGELQVAEDASGVRPQRTDFAYRETLRDAYLMAGLWPPLGMDGRAAMAADQEAYVDEHGEHKLRARPGPYTLPPECREQIDDAGVNAAARELARRSGISPSNALRVNAEHREELLEQLRTRDAQRARAEASTLQERLNAISGDEHHPACRCDACDPPASTTPTRPDDAAGQPTS